MSEKIFYNSINLLLGGDYKKLAKLRDVFGGWEKAWQAQGGKSQFDPEKEWSRLGDAGIKLFLRGEKGYPPLLKEIPFPPFGIYVLGNLPGSRTSNKQSASIYSAANNIPPVNTQCRSDINDTNSALKVSLPGLPEENYFSIVGTRKATPEGKTLAKKFSAELSRAGLAIISGLALGIDAAAHEGCLSAHGKTIAVLANGPDRFYPATNEKLGRQILEDGGAVISEYPLGSEPLPYRFLERNRIVSGLSRGILVIEAPENSGALATARFAMEQNRDVFVVPGPISHPNFQGSHKLIRQGATLVTKSEEILEELGMETAVASPVAAPETENEKIIFEALKKISSSADVDKLVEMTKLSAVAANQSLSTLTIKNIIKESGSGYTLNQ